MTTKTVVKFTDKLLLFTMHKNKGVTMSAEVGYELAGAAISWPIGWAAGMTNHPDIDKVAERLELFASLGLSFGPLGSWKLGAPSGGHGYEWNGQFWDYKGGDEHVDPELGAGYNAKGLPGPGTDKGMERFADFIDLGRSKGVEISLSMSPHTENPLEEFPEIIEIGRKALKLGALYYEINLSCPNIPERPPFYKDTESVEAVCGLLEEGRPLQNHLGRPGVYLKDGPRDAGERQVTRVGKSIGGWIRSNTLGNQELKLPDGLPAISVNGGKAGMSGPALEHLGRAQLQQYPQEGETISVLGISTGYEVKRRLDLGASAVQLASVLYWPELIGCETSAEAVVQIKEEFVEAMAA